MSKYLHYLLFLVILLAFSNVPQTFSQTKQTSIEAIVNNPGNFEGSEVEFSGLATQYVRDIGSTNYYLIKGDFGGIIRVNTAEPAPETNIKYVVKGIVYIDARTKRVFVSEKSKYPVEFPDPILSAPGYVEKNENATISWNAEDATKATLNGSPVETKGNKIISLNEATTFVFQAQYPNGKFKEKSVTITIIQQSHLLLYILIGALVILIIAFVYFQMNKRNLVNEVPPSNIYQEQIRQQHQQSYAAEYKEAKPEYTSDSDYKTIKIVRTSPKTLKFIPGKLVITDGADKGKEFKVAGYPTTNGFIVTIGRNEVNGDRAYAHIQLNEKTVSREQAELHYIDHKLYVKNLSETNFTQLNGVELSPGQTVEIQSGSTIKTGEVEFKYVV